MSINVRVRLFSIARDLARIDELQLDMKDGAHVREVYDYLVAYNDSFMDYKSTFRFAVNDEYVDNDHTLEDGDEVAVIPPVSGG
jgi:sulfur-carrier protein